MLKKTITYTDFDGNERTEDFYFNLTKAELTNMFNSVSGGLENQLRKILSAQDGPAIMNTVRDIVKAAYGEKSLDGRRFMKSEEIFKNFEETEAYSEFFMGLLASDEAVLDFIIGVLPKDMENDIRAEMKKMSAADPAKNNTALPSAAVTAG